MPPSRPPDPSAAVTARHGRWLAPGCTHRVTITTASRRRWFAHALVAIAVARELGSARLWGDNHVHAWVLMPDHLQLLLTLGGRDSLWQAVARAKSATGRVASAVIASSLPFWAEGFEDHVLAADDDRARAAREVISRPVHTGVADTLWAWPFWDSEWLPEPGADPCDIPRPTAAALAQLPACARISR